MRVLNPPDRILNQIIRHKRILLIQIRHGRNEPAIRLHFCVKLGNMRILNRLTAVGRRHKFAIKINPILKRKILHPPVAIATVVQDHIHDEFDPFLIGFLGQLSVLLIRPKTRINQIMIRDRIAMVTLLRLVIRHDRHIPNRRKSHVMNVRQSVNDSFEVPAMPTVHFAARWIRLTVSRFRVITRVAIRKAVGRD